VVGQQTFVAANVVITALKTNCIAMDDDRSALGKLHCMMYSPSMEANKTKILASKDPGELSYSGQATEKHYKLDTWQATVERKHFGNQTEI
jgi:hypothetical protein